jgi:predicted component of type VI protein secretion system
MNRTILLRHLANSSLVGQSREFRQDRVRLGRKRDNDVVFDPTLDQVVSGHHCEVVCEDGTLFVDDPGSTNGTYVNGRRVRGRMPVTDRDQITLGDQGPTFAVSFATGAGDAPRTIMGSVADLGAPPVGYAPAAGVGLLDAGLVADGRTDDLSPGAAVAAAAAAAAGGRAAAARARNGLSADQRPAAGPPPAIAPPPPRAAFSLEAPTHAAPPPLRPPVVPPLMAPPPRPPPERAASRASQGMPPPGPKASIGMNTLMAELTKATRRERRRMLTLLAPAAAAALLVAGGLAWHFGRGAPLPEVRTVALTAGPSQAVGLPGPVASPVPSVANPARTLDVPRAAAGPSTEPAAVTVATVGPPPVPPVVAPAPPPAAPPRAAPREWADVLAERKNGVYLVLVQSPGKQDSPQGTAWSVAPGVLATNAHVAELFTEIGPNDRLICRSNTNPPKDLRVSGVTVHPGYTEFARQQAAYYPVDPDTGARLSFPATYDAAVMTIIDADRDKQAPPLELADAATLAKLKETAELAYIGYPQEGSIEGGVNARMPEPHQFVGNLSRKTDVFLSAANDARSNLLQYTLIVQGGASGSPVFNRDGKVVGLVAGNDVIGRGNQGVRIMVSGKSFGPRADVVRELLDGTAAAMLTPVAAEWRAAFRERYEQADKAKRYAPLPDLRAKFAFAAVGEAKAAQGRPWKLTGLRKTPTTWTVTAADLAADGGTREFTTGPLPENGYYTIVLTTDNPDVTPRLTVPGSDTDDESASTKAAAENKQVRAALGDGTPHVAAYPVRRDARGTIRFTVGTATPSPGAEATLTATLYRAVATE